MKKMEDGISICEWAEALIPCVREKYGFGSDYEIKFFYQSENTTYMVRNLKTGEKTVLRICEPGYHTREELEGETEFIRAIRDYSDIITPDPVPGIDGAFVQEISSDEDGKYYCVLFDFVQGEAPKQENTENLGDYFYKLGELTAKMHRATIMSGISKHAVRPVWTLERLMGENAVLGNYRECPEFSQEDMEIFDQVEKLITERLLIYGKTEKNYGLVHSDLRLANLLATDDSIAVIDFDDSGYCWYLNDYGSAFSFIEDDENVPQLSESWLRGYESVRKLDKEDKEELPTFIMIRRLLLQGFLHSHTESEAIKDGIDRGYAEGTRKLAHRYLEEMSYVE